MYLFKNMIYYAFLGKWEKRMVILNDTKEYDDVWNKVYSDLGFKPSCDYRGHSLNVTLPFSIGEPHIIYAIENMSDSSFEKFEELVRI